MGNAAVLPSICRFFATSSHDRSPQLRLIVHSRLEKLDCQGCEANGFGVTYRQAQCRYGLQERPLNERYVEGGQGVSRDGLRAGFDRCHLLMAGWSVY